MTVLAIDPGSEKSAMLVWDGREVKLHTILTNAELLIAIHEPEIKPDLVCAEMIQSYGMPVGSEVFETCYFLGRVMDRCQMTKMPFHRVYRKEVKMHLCNDPKAKDPNIRAALIDRFGGKEKAIGRKGFEGPLYGIASHAWSALAIAVTAYDTTRKLFEIEAP